MVRKERSSGEKGRITKFVDFMTAPQRRGFASYDRDPQTGDLFLTRTPTIQFVQNVGDGVQRGVDRIAAVWKADNMFGALFREGISIFNGEHREARRERKHQRQRRRWRSHSRVPSDEFGRRVYMDSLTRTLGGDEPEPPAEPEPPKLRPENKRQRMARKAREEEARKQAEPPTPEPPPQPEPTPDSPPQPEPQPTNGQGTDSGDALRDTLAYLFAAREAARGGGKAPEKDGQPARIWADAEVISTTRAEPPAPLAIEAPTSDARPAEEDTPDASSTIVLEFTGAEGDGAWTVFEQDRSSAPERPSAEVYMGTPDGPVSTSERSYDDARSSSEGRDR